MTHEQNDRSAQSLALNGTDKPFEDEQYAILDRPTMSNNGLLSRYTSSPHRLSGGWLVHPEDSEGDDDELETRSFDVAQLRTQRDLVVPIAFGTVECHPIDQSVCTIDRGSQTMTAIEERPRKRVKTTFYEFAAQTRLHQHHERRKRHLQTRSRVLQRSVALAARLKRASSWVQDGLVEISRHQDTAGFVHVFSHANDLVDTCWSHWNNELQKIDMVLDTSSVEATPGPKSFMDQLPRDAQRDLLKLLSDLRGNPQFLIDRISQLPLSQVATLTAKPKWEASDALLASLSQQSGSQRRRRVLQYSRELEDYATSFERTDPFAFLLHNIYSNDSTPDSPESQLRLWTWSSICAGLMMKRSESYNKLYWQALEAFSAMRDWPAKTRMELFLMDTLQRGAFLIKDSASRGKANMEHLKTRQASEFFEESVVKLYQTLISCRTGLFPTGALQLAQAILGKLDNEQQQSDFRMHFLQNWYFNHFLKAAVMYPENENMLLKMHVSRRARDCVLAPIFNLFMTKFENFMEPDMGVGQDITDVIWEIVNMLEAKETVNPYLESPVLTDEPTSNPGPTPTFVLCAAECVKIIETLSPQAIFASHYQSDRVMQGMGHAFQATYSNPATRFDLLKYNLLQLNEPGNSPKDIHPVLEVWSNFEVRPDGVVLSPELPEESSLAACLEIEMHLNTSQRAALRLCTERFQLEDADPTFRIPHWTPDTTLRELFQAQTEAKQAAYNMVDFVYWKRALSDFKTRHPLMLGNDDSRLLTEPTRLIRGLKQADVAHCESLEAEIGPLESFYFSLKKHIAAFVAVLEELRLKLWYTAEIVSSPRYVDARNVALALSHMNILHLRMTTGELQSKFGGRPASSRSTIASSIISSQPQEVMEILKAPTEYGGPRKLADAQLDTIRQWFKSQNIDNFCKGEERLHRFCMEIWQISRSLTGESMIESEELWASELFNRERTSYEVPYYGTSSAPASTRPASIYSDNFSTSTGYGASRSGVRSADSDSRSMASDDRGSHRRGPVYGLFEKKLFHPNPQLLTGPLAESMRSYSRTSSSATSARSDIFSLPGHSTTSISVSTGPPSILAGSLPNFGRRNVKSRRDMQKFRDKLRTGLVCLLLSDLGSLVWSWGCETDTWLQKVQNSPDLMTRLDKRLGSEKLHLEKQNQDQSASRRRSESVNAVSRTTEAECVDHNSLPSDNDVQINYTAVLRDILNRMSQQIDPIGKLQACLDFDTLAMEQLRESSEQALDHRSVSPQPGLACRRNSDPNARRQELDSRLNGMSSLTLTDPTDTTEKRTIHHFKTQLARLRPETLFRDLQYIAVFTPGEILDTTPAGKAFMRLGYAAVEYKQELANSMVNVAAQIVAADSIKRKQSKTEPSLARAADYWKIAAMEGNKVAQRELALMYLMHPEALSVVSLPLSPSSKIFRDDMMWQKQVGSNNSRQALCLALHWMQQAADGGDSIAKQKLREREGSISIR